METYHCWYNHGEQLPPRPSGVTMQQSYYEVEGNMDTYNMEQMVMDHVGPSTGCMLEHDDQPGNEDDNIEEERYKIVKRRGKVTRMVRKKMWYFPITPRLQRLYASLSTAKHMRCVV
ncbi:hypothetical protein RJT34_16649 [Clitoria ternatea]|uniref:Uncharacterized protein n=1 Tax=Clitoria ternatea TaxID=43366 RepID=A0AAN9J941_CLITE